MNYHEIYATARDWMNNRGWRTVYGKLNSFTQSLLQHTDIELNVLLELLPILEREKHYNLSITEQQSLIVGQVVHDVGKETDKWQKYVRSSRAEQKGQFVPHVLRPLTRDAVVDLVETLGFPDIIVDDAIKFVNLHMKATRNPTNMMHAILGKSSSQRWNVLARIVDTIDNICSIPNLLSTLQAIEQDQRGGAIGPHIKVAYHLLNLRGVSSVLLHKAAEQAYINSGWRPLIYFSNGTIYISDSLESHDEPTAEEILQLLSRQIDEVLPVSRFPKMVVGSPIATFLPKPDFFDYREIKLYLSEATHKIGRKSFLRKSLIERRRVVEKTYEDLDAISDDEVDNYSERIDCAQPEMLAFKFFKAATSSDIVGKNGAFVQSDEIENLKSLLIDPTCSEKDSRKIIKQINKIEKGGFEEWIEQLRIQYEAIFGENSFAALQATSTFMPAKEMATIIEPFWSLSAIKFGFDVEYIGDLSEERRMNLLLSLLEQIAMDAYELLSEDVRPTRATSLKIAQTFTHDLVHPTSFDIELLAEQQLEFYRTTKKQAFKEGNAERICPICNTQFSNGTRAKADFLDKPSSHTNRAIAHGANGNIIICNTCKFERFLQQLLLGQKVEKVLAITPRNHIGRWTGEILVTDILKFSEVAENLMSNSTLNPNQNMTLTLTNIISRKMFKDGDEKLNRLAEAGLDGTGLAQLLTYEMIESSQKKYRRMLFNALCKEYDLGKDTEIAEWNEELCSHFDSVDALLDAIIHKEFIHEITDVIRKETYPLDPQFSVVCQTPNFVLIPMKYSFGSDQESNANSALRELFTSLLIGLTLDCTVATISSGEIPTFKGGEGIAQVPAIPAIRALVNSKWVSLSNSRIWIEKIGAASLLANAAAYPERSNLYQILTAPTAGHILRRLEMKSDSGQATFDQIQLIEKAIQPTLS